MCSAIILDLDQWGRDAGPKSADQWVDGRSAKEAARYWLAAPATLPPAFAGALANHPDFGAVAEWYGEPEVRLTFDSRRGEPRNTDLLLNCVDNSGPFLIALEAKADETFGETVAEAAAAALDRRLSNPRSRAYERVLDLAAALLPPPGKGLPAIGELRYQLLTAAAGALAEGQRRRVDRVVLAIQEFRTNKTTDTRIADNSADLGRFLMRLTGGSTNNLNADELLGPFMVPGAPLFTAAPKLYVLKVRVDLRECARTQV